MSTELLDRLDEWKSRFGSPDTSPLEQLLATIATERFPGAEALIRLHETVLFLRAYPASRKVARLADAILFSFGKRVAGLQAACADLEAFEAPEVSGIAGTSLAAVFDYEVARRLARRHPRNVEIAWDRYDEAEKLGAGIWRFVPLLEEDWPVEAHVPYRQWMEAARRLGVSDFAWLLERVEALPLPPRDRAALYDSLQVPLIWRLGNAKTPRSRLRLAGRKLHLHREPLLRRSDVSLAREPNGPLLPIRRLSRPEARKVLDLIL